MGDITLISWAQRTFNPWIGCMKVGPGCDHCYAEARDVRFEGGAHWGPGAPRRRTSTANWRKPLQWDREAKRDGIRLRVFCASLADVFDNEVDPEWRADLFNVIRSTPNLDWMLLTKRPGNIVQMLPVDWGAGWKNVWLGCSIVTQAEADREIDKLLHVPAAVHWLSMEPLIETVDLRHRVSFLDWIVVGGESGHGARHFDIEWARSLLRQARAADTAFHFKQLSQADYPASYGDFDSFPLDLQVREFPR